jgi:RNA polymerase sigma-70 factor, ECF subfamily
MYRILLVGVEECHKSIEVNMGLAKSQIKMVKTQAKYFRLPILACLKCKYDKNSRFWSGVRKMGDDYQRKITEDTRRSNFLYYCTSFFERMVKPANLETILVDLANEDKHAFDELYRLYYPKLYIYSKSFLKIDSGIDDILQEVFVKVWMNRQNIKKVETYNAFLYTVTKNTLLNEIRSRLKSEEFRTDLFYKSVAAEFITQQAVEYNDIKRQLDQLVLQLPEKRRKIYLMSREEGKPNAEIAAELGISVKTVEDHMTHSLRFLKDRLRSLGLAFALFCNLFF